ncbi:hypothetical protein [Alicyclobacillus sp. SO9]|uniref:hypothetical protein n=1 Tax=Alicyclobacillus sp. SO9 TaxID=2665646 RepID=UPI0018E6FC26|nr:hypothetical protein [Alicyclobacillus sp. SO9]QQE80084.1 hypothetical protein GI364_06375 [Alicyclobacillus sp. SO9]
MADGSNINFNPLGVTRLDGDTDMKLVHDKYDVYVNADFVGSKVLLSAAESADDISSYLTQAGFNGFSATLRGDHFHLEVDSEEKADEMKNQLNVYLNLR